MVNLERWGLDRHTAQMGLKDAPRGLGDLLLDSPPRDQGTVTALNVRRLSGDLQSALEYVLQGAVDGSSGSGGGSTPLVKDGCIDYTAVAQHVQHAVQGTSATEVHVTSNEDVVSSIADAEQRLATAELEEGTRAGGSSSDGGGGSPGQPPPLLEAPSPPAELAAASGPGSSGRLGPAEVTLVEAKGSCEINGGWAMSRREPLPPPLPPLP